MSIHLPVYEYVPMSVTVEGYEENYDRLGLGRNLAWLLLLWMLVHYPASHTWFTLLIISEINDTGLMLANGE